MIRIEFVFALVVVAGASAAFAIPKLTRSTHCEGGNETAAIATLRNLASCQAQFQTGRECDLDGDGRGEYGTFGEMTAADGVRADAGGATRGAVLSPAILSPALANVDGNGFVTKSGHAFRIFLPGAKGGGIHEGKATSWSGGGCPKVVKDPAPPAAVLGTPFSGPVDADAAETRWCAYAWPVAYGNSGSRAFFVDQGGDVWWTENKGGRYQGISVAVPAWDAALPADGKSAWSPAPDAKEYLGRDGNTWKRTN